MLPRWPDIAPRSHPRAPPGHQKTNIFIMFYDVFAMCICSKPNRSGETLSPILQSHNCSKLATRLPNIVQPSAKMAPDSLQERSQHCKKPLFSLCFTMVLQSVTFCKGRARDSTKVTKLLSKARQVAHLRIILAPTWAILTPSWHPLGDHFLTILRPLEPS